MGRETKILLALLGLLVGVFLGVVSIKLFVPRPPAGAGPDVHADLTAIEAQTLVEPPELGRPPATAAEFAAMTPPPAVASPPADDPYAGRTSRFGGDAPPTDGPRDPFVQPASFAAENPETQPPAPEILPPLTSQSHSPAPEPVLTAPARSAIPDEPRATTSDLLPPPGFDQPQPTAPLATDTTYVAQEGDSWWSLAERAYGDGRLYRALFAWNRMSDPRITLSPGTRLEIPVATKLGAAWPKLLPRD